MSLLRPKNGDYAVRGLFLLIAWICIIAPGPFAIAGALLAGARGAAAGLLAGIFAGIGAYSWYLRYEMRR